MLTRTLLVVVSSFGVILTAELVLRAIGYPAAQGYGWGPTALRDYSREQPVPPSDVYRILLIGDSQVGNRSEVSDPLPGEILEAALNDPNSGVHAESSECGSLPLRIAELQSPYSKAMVFDVETLGEGGWGQDQQLLALSNTLKFEEFDLVLLWFTPENDLWNNAFPTHWPLNGYPKPTFVLESDGKLRLMTKDEMFDEPPKIVTLSKRGLEKTLAIFGAEISSAHVLNADQDWDSKYISNLPTLDAASTHAEEPDRMDSTPMEIDTAFLSRFNPYVDELAEAYEKSQFSAQINPASKRIDYMMRLTRELVLSIQREAVSRGAHFESFWFDASGTPEPLYPPDQTYRYLGREVVFSDQVKDYRMSKIFEGIPHAELKLDAQRWRKPNSDPHLTTQANGLLMRKLARCLTSE